MQCCCPAEPSMHFSASFHALIGNYMETLLLEWHLQEMHMVAEEHSAIRTLIAFKFIYVGLHEA